MDRQNIIKALERCLICDISVVATDEAQKAYLECEYTVGLYCGQKKVLQDALKLLKEQEEKQTPKPIILGDKEEYWGEEEICPVCGKRWQSANIYSTHFCPGCGQAVIWENT